MARAERYEEYLAAAIQPRHEPDPRETVEKLVDLVKEAAARGAKLVVLPECSSAGGYIYNNLEDALERAEPIPGPFSLRMANLARQLDIYLVVGLAEREGESVYNTGIVLSPTGEISGKYRKNYLVSFDKRWFSVWEGDDNYPVWDTPLGRLAILICGDARLPENARCLALKGAEVLCYPTLWGAWDQYLYNCPTRAIENKVWLIASDKVGTEQGMDYPGRSFIMDPDGNFLARASDEQEEIIYALIRPDRARDKRLKDGTDLFATRRTDTYGLLTKPASDLVVSDHLMKAVVPSMTNVLAASIELNADFTSKKELTATAIALTRDAARLCCSLILLPDLWSLVSSFTPEYWAEPVPGPTSEAFGELAEREGVYVSYGAIEADGQTLYKTTVLVGPRGGIVGRYRAIHLSNSETAWAKAGDDYVVCQTEFGQIGLMSGIDGYFFEAARSLALLGADAILWPCDFGSRLEPELLAVERSIENKVFLLAASKRGRSGMGSSLIVDPRGIVLACGTAVNQIIKAQVQLVLSRCKEALPKTDLILHRRPETYKRLAAPGGS